MRLRDTAFTKGLATGLVLGLVMTGALSATAATGRKAWDQFGDMFKAGYVAGFTDCLRIAEGLDYHGYLATTYTLPPRASGVHWIKAIDEIYKDERHAKRQLPQMILLAGMRLEKRFGPETRLSEPNAAGLRAFFNARRRSMIEARKAKAALDAERGDAEKSAKADSEQADSNKKAEAERKPDTPATDPDAGDKK